MATTKVSALSAKASLAGSEELLINDGGTSKKVTATNLLAGAAVADGSISTAKIADDAVTEAKLANAINTAIAANTAKTSNATHTGDVTGATALTIAADAVTGAKIADNAIDSEHYTDGSIDTAHIGDDQVTADKLANSINTEIAANTAKTSNATHSGEVTGATALTIADNVVDEANLKVSNAPTNGYFLSAQSGDTGGMTWAAAGGGMAAGTVVAFFQASAPTGWTQVTSQNDKVLRVVSGTGGGTGGTWATNSGVTSSEVAAHTHTSAAHTHTGAAHTHSHNLAAGAHTLSESEIPAHSHSGVITSLATGAVHRQYNTGIVSGTTGSTANTGGGGSHSHSLSGSVSSGGDGATGSTTPGATGSANAHTHTISAPQYIDMIIAAKD